MIHALLVAALVLPLAVDTFVLAAALGAAGLEGRDRLRVSLVFSAFEGGMPVVGFLFGAALATVVGGLADYAGALVLGAIGAWLLWPRADAEEEEERRLRRLASARGFGLLALGLSISLDELAMGFGGGLLRLPLALLVVLIVLQAFLFAQAGLRLGARLAERTREGAERAAGALLVVAALLVLAEKLFGS